MSEITGAFTCFGWNGDESEPMALLQKAPVNVRWQGLSVKR